MRYFAQQGVELKVISGDNVQTVSGIARRAGLANAERAIDATTLQTEEDIDAAVSQYTVFGRVTPQQKRQKELVKFRNALEKGQKIITAGGIYGTVKEVKDAYVLMEVDNNVTIRVDKNMIMKDPADLAQQGK